MASWEELNKLMGVFERFDKDKSGSIDRGEFGEFMAALGKTMTAAELDAGFAQIDVDGSGVIEFDEFVDWWQERHA